MWSTSGGLGIVRRAKKKNSKISHLQYVEYIKSATCNKWSTQRGLRKILTKKLKVRKKPLATYGVHSGDFEKFFDQNLSTCNIWSKQDLVGFSSQVQPLAENSLYKRLVIFSPLYISYYYRVKKQRLRKTAIWAYVRRGRVVIECSRAAEAAYYIELFFDLCLLGGEFTHCSTAIAGACYQCLALRVLSARLKHVIVSWWTSFSV